MPRPRRQSLPLRPDPRVRPCCVQKVGFPEGRGRIGVRWRSAVVVQVIIGDLGARSRPGYAVFTLRFLVPSKSSTLFPTSVLTADIRAHRRRADGTSPARRRRRQGSAGVCRSRRPQATTRLWLDRILLTDAGKAPDQRYRPRPSFVKLLLRSDRALARVVSWPAPVRGGGERGESEIVSAQATMRRSSRYFSRQGNVAHCPRERFGAIRSMRRGDRAGVRAGFPDQVSRPTARRYRID